MSCRTVEGSGRRMVDRGGLHEVVVYDRGLGNP